MKGLNFKQIIDIILIIILLVFAGQNVAAVHLKFLFFDFEFPLIIIIAFVFFIGYLTALLFRKTDKPKKEKSEKINIMESINDNALNDKSLE